LNLAIKGKVALITASSDGMGKNVAGALAAEGVNVVLFSRTAEKLQAVAREIEQAQRVKVLPVAGSMLVGADIDRLASAIKSEFGGLDILFSIPGVPQFLFVMLSTRQMRSAGTKHIERNCGAPSMLPRPWCLPCWSAGGVASLPSLLHP